MSAEAPVPGHDGDLIRQARLRMVPSMSIPRAAALTGDAPGNWGCVERGYQDLGGDRGRRTIMHPPAQTLARMSSAVGVTPRQWEDRGRGDVAAILRVIMEDRRRQCDAVSAALADADSAFLRVIRDSPILSAEQKSEYARLWHHGGREKVAAVAARMLAQLSDRG